MTTEPKMALLFIPKCDILKWTHLPNQGLIVQIKRSDNDGEVRKKYRVRAWFAVNKAGGFDRTHDKVLFIAKYAMPPRYITVIVMRLGFKLN